MVVAACGEGSGPASLEFLSISPAQPRIGDIVTVKFRAIDARGMPAEGMPVRFRTESNAPGVSLQPAEGSTNKGSGEVTTQIVASTRVSSLVVIAESGDKIAQSPPITVAGTTVSDRGITFQCGPTNGLGSGGIHALMAYGPGRDLISGVKVTCTAHVADRNGDGIPNALVSFLTEAGTIGPTAQSITDAVGNADILYKTSLPLPKDVDPGRYFHNPAGSSTTIVQPLAPDWMHPWEWRANPMASPPPDPACAAGCDEPRRADPVRPGRINNPRDNLVAMIAVTAGEESFVDVNNNGNFDQGEPFVDTVEPFVDANDNGTWDADELYIDTNGDGQWSPMNGVHDKNTLIWAQNRILWTGIPNDYDYADNPPSNPPPGYVPTIGTINTPGGTDIAHLGHMTGEFVISDPWFNVWAQNSGSDGCKAVSSENVTSSLGGGFGDQGIRTRYPTVLRVGFSIRDVHSTEEVPASQTYNVGITCTSTASPDSGAVYNIGVGGITGTVQ